MPSMHFSHVSLLRPKKGSSLGVEHAGDEAILEALEKMVTPINETDDYQEIPRQTLIEYGLIAGAHAKERREKLGDELRIGYTNSKQLTKRLKMFRITEKELIKAMNDLNALPSEKSEESI